MVDNLSSGVGLVPASKRAMSTRRPPSKKYPMSESRAVQTKKAMAKAYAAGIVVFSAFFGLMTLVVLFVSRLET